MTVSSDVSKAAHKSASGVTDYAFNFKVFKAGELRVAVAGPDAETALTPGVDYTVAGLNQDAGGKVSLTAGGKAKAGSGKTLVIRRNMGFVQEIDYRPHDVFPAETHEKALDVLTMQDQELRETLGRAVLAPEGQDGAGAWEKMAAMRDAAAQSAGAAKNSENAAKASAADAAASAGAAKDSATAAASSSADAKNSAGAAAKSAEAARTEAGRAVGYAAQAEAFLNGVFISQQLWIEAVNAVRLTEAGLRRSIEIYNVGGF